MFRPCCFCSQPGVCVCMTVSRCVTDDTWLTRDVNNGCLRLQYASNKLVCLTCRLTASLGKSVYTVPNGHNQRQRENLSSQPPPNCIRRPPWSLSKNFVFLFSLETRIRVNGDKAISWLCTQRDTKVREFKTETCLTAPPPRSPSITAYVALSGCQIIRKVTDAAPSTAPSKRGFKKLFDWSILRPFDWKTLVGCISAAIRCFLSV